MLILQLFSSNLGMTSIKEGLRTPSPNEGEGQRNKSQTLSSAETKRPVGISKDTLVSPALTLPENPPSSKKPPENIIFTREKKSKQIMKRLGERKKLKEDAASKGNGLELESEKKLNEQPNSKSWLEKKFGKHLDRLAAWELLFLAEHQVVDNIPINMTKASEKRLGELMSDPDALIVVLTNHQSIAEIVGKAKLFKKLTKIINKSRGFDDSLPGKLKRKFKQENEQGFPGIIVTYAGSLTPNGQRGQGSIAEQLAIQLKKKLKRNSLHMEAYMRKKDEDKYELSRKDNDKLAAKLVQYIKKGFGMDFFTPGTVEESRFTDEDGERNRKGIQELDCTQYLRLWELAERLGKKIVVLKVGMDGGYNLVDPTDGENPTPTKKVIKACLDPRNSPGVRSALKLVHANTKPLMTINVGMPMTKEEILEDVKNKNGGELTVKGINDHVGYGLAELLPTEARGVYA